MKILMVITSHDKLGDTGRKTGFWLEELAAPFMFSKMLAPRSCLRLQKVVSRRSIPRATNQISGLT